jgi:hypothetical protein
MIRRIVVFPWASSASSTDLHHRQGKYALRQACLFACLFASAICRRRSFNGGGN